MGHEAHDRIQFIQLAEPAHTQLRGTQEAVDLPAAERGAVMTHERLAATQFGPVAALHMPRHEQAKGLVFPSVVFDS